MGNELLGYSMVYFREKQLKKECYLGCFRPTELKHVIDIISRYHLDILLDKGSEKYKVQKFEWHLFTDPKRLDLILTRK